MRRPRRCGSSGPKRLESWRYGEPGAVDLVPVNELGEDSWRFADAETSALFGRIKAAFPDELGTLAEIYRRRSDQRRQDLHLRGDPPKPPRPAHFDWNHRDWPIERGILRPSLRRSLLDAPLRPFQRPEPNTWIILPYELVAECKRDG